MDDFGMFLAMFGALAISALLVWAGVTAIHHYKQNRFWALAEEEDAKAEPEPKVEVDFDTLGLLGVRDDDIVGETATSAETKSLDVMSHPGARTYCFPQTGIELESVPEAAIPDGKVFIDSEDHKSYKFVTGVDGKRVKVCITKHQVRNPGALPMPSPGAMESITFRQAVDQVKEDFESNREFVTELERTVEAKKSAEMMEQIRLLVRAEIKAELERRDDEAFYQEAVEDAKNGPIKVHDEPYEEYKLEAAPTVDQLAAEYEELSDEDILVHADAVRRALLNRSHARKDAKNDIAAKYLKPDSDPFCMQYEQIIEKAEKKRRSPKKTSKKGKKSSKARSKRR